MKLQNKLESNHSNVLRQSNISDCGRLFSLCLALFGGVVMVAGLHRIYAGRYLSGFVMMCTLGGVFVWTLIDLGYLLSGAFLDSEGRPIQRWFVEDSD